MAKLDLQNMTYGGILVALVISAIVGGVLIFTDAEGTTYYLSSDGADATWECKDPTMKSDCINGIKASGKRCYYDPDNGRKYKNCAGLWDEIQQKKITSGEEWDRSKLDECLANDGGCFPLE